MGKIAIGLNFAFIAFLGVNAFASAEGRAFLADLKQWYEKEKARQQAESARRAQEYQRMEKSKKEASEALAARTKEAQRTPRTPTTPSTGTTNRTRPSDSTPRTTPATPRPATGGGDGWSGLLKEGDDYWKQAMDTPNPSGKKALLQKALDCYKRALDKAPSSENQEINMRITGVKKAMPI